MEASSLRRYELAPGDLVLEKSGGGDKQPVGMAVLFEGGERAICSNFCARITPACNIDSRFLNYVFTSTYKMGLTESSIKQATGIQNLDTRAFFDNEWAWPPLKEQRHIADFLDSETAKLDQISMRSIRISYLLAARKAAFMDMCFQAGIGEFLDTLPLRRVVERWIDYRGATPEKTVSGIPLVTAKNIKSGSIDLDASREYVAEEDYNVWMRRGLLSHGDVLLTTEAPLGEVALVEDTKVALAQRVILLRADRRYCSPEWIYWWLRSPRGQFELALRATGSTALGIKADRLRGVPIPMTDGTDSAERVRKLQQDVTELDALERKLERQRLLLTERRQALITAAVTGEIDVSTASGRGIEE
ncbi:restriction endonuclease subunit S [Actinopolyspora mzabensis]|uniref:restriction endonuclease subunit S n=1 Tax=Actinopolyspora mzabensis TaxID=995066 RepID=UPI0015A174C7|nr:restriction endonuclease subunit S [Actinopolyspora mzabensis]